MSATRRWTTTTWALLALLWLGAGCGDATAPAPGGSAPSGGESGEAEAVSPEPWGSVEAVLGDGAFELCAPTCQPVRPGAALPVGAAGKTDGTSRASLRLGDKSKLQVDAESRFVLRAQGEVALEQGRFVVESDEAKLVVDTPAGVVEIDPHGVASVVVEPDPSKPGATRARVDVVRGGATLRREGAPRALAAGEAVVSEEGGVRVLPSADLAYQTAWAREMSVEAEVSDGPSDAPRGVGSLVGRSPATREVLPKAIEVPQLDVQVEVQDRAARTQITQSFHNTTGQTLEGVYTFPLPHDASITRFALEIRGQWMEGEVVEHGRAVKIFDSVVADYMRPRDPALLEWKGGNTFQIRIFPIFPKTTQKVLLSYTQVLPADGTARRYTYPLPRTGDIAVQKFTFGASVSGSQAISSLKTPMYATSLTPSPDGREAGVSFVKDEFRPRQDMVLEWSVPQYDEPLTLTASDRDPGQDGYFMMVLRPKLPVGGDGPATSLGAGARDHLFLVDTSSGTAPGDLKASVAAVASYLSTLGPDDRFNVLAADQEVRRWKDAMQPVQHDTVAQALAFLEGQTPGGATDLEGMFQAARALLDPPSEKRAPPVLVYLGDGQATLGELRHEPLLDALERGLGDVRPTVHALGVGSDVNVGLLQVLTRSFGGSLEVLNRGEELLVVGRYRGSVDGQATLTGLIGDEPFAQPFRVKLEPGTGKPGSFVPQIWAQRHVEHLTLYGGAQNRDAIVEASRYHRVMSRFTTFLVLESERMFQQFKVDRDPQRLQWSLDASRLGHKGEEKAEKDAEKPKEEESAKADPKAAAGEATPDPALLAERRNEQARPASPPMEANKEAAAANKPEPVTAAMPTDAPAPTMDSLAAPSKSAREDSDNDLRAADDSSAFAQDERQRTWSEAGGEDALDDDVAGADASTRSKGVASGAAPLAGDSSGDAGMGRLGTTGAGKGGGGFAAGGPKLNAEPRAESKPADKKSADKADAWKDESPRAKLKGDPAPRSPGKRAIDRGGIDYFGDGGGGDAWYQPRYIGPTASIRSLTPDMAEAGEDERKLEQAVEAEPLRRDLRRKLLQARLRRGDGEGSLSVARGWVENDPGNAEARWRLADLLGRQGYGAESLRSFGDAIELSPQDVVALRTWARSLTLREERRLAVASHRALWARTGSLDDGLDLVAAEALFAPEAAKDHLAHLRASRENEMSAEQRKRADALAEVLRAGRVAEPVLKEDALKGQAVVSLGWEGSEDLDLSVVLPHGERISADVPRSTKAQGKRGYVEAEASTGSPVGSAKREAREAVVLPTMPQGTYRVEVVRRGEVASAPVRAWVKVRAMGQTRTFQVEIGAGDRDARVAEMSVVPGYWDSVGPRGRNPNPYR